MLLLNFNYESKGIILQPRVRGYDLNQGCASWGPLAKSDLEAYVLWSAERSRF